MDLLLVVSVSQWELVNGSILVLAHHGDLRTWVEVVLNTLESDLVSWLDLVVVWLVLEVEGKKTLLLEVGFVDTSE